MPAYKNDTGRWYCAFYYKDWTGKRRKKKKESFATRREALAFEHNFLEEQAGAPDMTFEALCELYKDDCSLHLKQSTMLSKFAMIEKHILPRFRQLRVNEITPAGIRAWQNEVLGMGYSPSYCYSLHRQLSAVLNFACRYYGLASNPAARAGSIGRNEEHQAFWTLDDFRCFAMTLTDPAQIMLFYLLFWTGCRIGEALALTWHDVGSDSIRISKTLSYLHGGVYVRPPKTRESNRTVKLPSFLSMMLADYRRISSYTGVRLFHTTSSAAARLLARHAKQAGLERIRLHDLRHSHASMLIQAGVPAIAIAERLGHKNAQTTLRVYAHLYQSTKDEVVSVLEKI
ncbi:site-specific integrase [uncultured Mitsuokella sp.]|uniref:site-specific integrase n=1 Tax=uncultured Mitsuokella sp. TaxID=453120 RepID=UPI0026704345|nr:site-specific integrase [uncultured Mitsuokella sp.]